MKIIFDFLGSIIRWVKARNLLTDTSIRWGTIRIYPLDCCSIINAAFKIYLIPINMFYPLHTAVEYDTVIKHNNPFDIFVA